MTERIGDKPPESDDYEVDQSVPASDLDREIARRIRHSKGLANGEQVVSVYDSESGRKAKIVGSTAAIAIAAGLLAGYWTARKIHEKKKRR